MLSKSQAKAFFIIGTAAFSAIFVGLTIDTFQKIPAQTHSEKLTDEVIHGKKIFGEKNCMGCHTILGEGAYYAPELTKVYDRRGSAFIQSMLRNPEAMYPGQRKMTNFHFTEEEINSLTAFLKWVGEMDLNGFPPKPDLAATTSTNTILKDRPKIFGQVCIACHSLNGEGGQVGPALDSIGVGFRDVPYFQKWLKDPNSVKQNAKMPKLPLSDEEISELATFLSTLKGNN